MNAATKPEQVALETIAPEQHDRQKYIGGSDIAAILGISPWKTATQLWMDKIKPRVDDGRNHAAKARGTRLEPYILDMIQQEHGLTVAARGQRYRDKSVPFFAAEIDAEFMVNGAIENGEIKTAHPFKAKEWGEEDTDALPVHYTAQVQWGMGITGRPRCRVFVLIGDDLRSYVVERDDEIIEAMRKQAGKFWLEYVVPLIQPPLDYGHSTTLDTLRKLYPGTNGETVPSTAMQEHWRAVAKDAARMAKHYESVCDAARAHLLSEMGENAAIDFGDGEVFRRKLIKKREITIVQPATTYMDARFAKKPTEPTTNEETQA